MQSTTKITVRYAETDRMCVAHHANYLIWYEQARTDFTRQLGFSYRQAEEMGLLSPVVSVESNYHRSCTYEDELTVTCRLIRLTPAQMVFSYSIQKAGEDSPVNTGTSRHTWVDRETFRPVNLRRRAPELYAALQGALEAEVSP